jgi:tetratricopeptide (TPR) repeat protein
MTQMRVITTYIRLIFLPVNQNLDYDYPVYRSFFDPPVFLSFMFLVSIIGFGVYMLRISRGRGEGIVSQEEGEIGERGRGDGTEGAYYRIVGFGIFWFFIALSVTSSVVPIADVIFEHRVYLPSVGVFMAMTTSVFMIMEKLKRRRGWIERAVIWVCAVLVVVLSGTTYARNIVWQDGISLWKDVVEKSQKKARAQFNLANFYRDMDIIDKAIEHYKLSIKIDPYFPKAHNNLGLAYGDMNLPEKAIEHYKTAIRLKPAFELPHFNLGMTYLAGNLLYEARKEFEIALSIKPDYQRALFFLNHVNTLLDSQDSQNLEE